MMKATADKPLISHGASAAMMQFLSLSARSEIGILIQSNLGPGRDCLVNYFIESMNDQRPVLLFGQSVWPPVDRPGKSKADITSGVKTKHDLFSRLSQVSPGTALIASSDCGLSLFTLLEACMRSKTQLIYLMWSSSSENLESVAHTLLQSESVDSQRKAMAEALPIVLPMWVTLRHATDQSYVVERISEILSFDLGQNQSEIPLKYNFMKSRELFKFVSDGMQSQAGFRGHFQASGFLPTFFNRLAKASDQLQESTSEELTLKLFPSGPFPGVSTREFPYPNPQMAASLPQHLQGSFGYKSLRGNS